MKIIKKRLKKIDLIVEMAGYCLDWQNEPHKNRHMMEPYDHGGIETLGHMIACCVTQWFTGDSTDTGEVCDALKLSTHPKAKKLKKLLIKFIKQL